MTHRAIALACAAAFILLSLRVASGAPMPGDEPLLQAAISVRSEWLTGLLAIPTFISSAVPALLITGILSLVEVRRVWLATRPHGTRPSLQTWLSAGWPSAVYLGALASNIGLRILVGRLPPKVSYIPNVLPELHAEFQRFAFPSGHAGAALLTYGALAAVAWPNSRWRWPAIAGGAVIVLSAGFGRPYLGVHWPSDVLGGYLLAGVWLAIGLMLRDKMKLASLQP